MYRNTGEGLNFVGGRRHRELEPIRSTESALQLVGEMIEKKLSRTVPPKFLTLAAK